ncbi:hypothetical protein BJ875DRAFT_448551 [Amylocarpus encephaloides]|uniref:Uncharacterized protein n=1 Tax=Amylocarpus encephaloides TaxID=45428 RepID=A0A9P8CAC9_9HELO|nr:hypothetical protein BJ875DRAFT_448551 [Amylocarpus encephaloides]
MTQENLLLDHFLAIAPKLEPRLFTDTGSDWLLLYLQMGGFLKDYCPKFEKRLAPFMNPQLPSSLQNNLVQAGVPKDVQTISDLKHWIQLHPILVRRVKDGLVEDETHFWQDYVEGDPSKSAKEAGEKLENWLLEVFPQFDISWGHRQSWNFNTFREADFVEVSRKSSSENAETVMELKKRRFTENSTAQIFEILKNFGERRTDDSRSIAQPPLEPTSVDAVLKSYVMIEKDNSGFAIPFWPESIDVTTWNDDLIDFVKGVAEHKKPSKLLSDGSYKSLRHVDKVNKEASDKTSK